MSWAGIASNQCVSLNNLKDAVATNVFTALTTIPSGTKQITKSEALSYVDVQTAPLSSKTTNQLVVKSNLITNQEWYRAYYCSTPAIIIYSVSYPTGTFALNNRITTAEGIVCVINQVTGGDPQPVGSHFFFYATGQIGCP